MGTSYSFQDVIKKPKSDVDHSYPEEATAHFWEKGAPLRKGLVGATKTHIRKGAKRKKMRESVSTLRGPLTATDQPEAYEDGPSGVDHYSDAEDDDEGDVGVSEVIDTNLALLVRLDDSEDEDYRDDEGAPSQTPKQVRVKTRGRKRKIAPW